MSTAPRYRKCKLINYFNQSNLGHYFFLLQIIDYFNAVEQLHKLEINKIIPKLKTDARWATVPRRNKPPSKVTPGLPVPRHNYQNII